ncbi:MAG: D-psicose/D-tagatose/L-ribulose 3-epimerase [Thermoleophilales bacterium]|nr:D-psicose/D-tagatose/L-ribulose 3-epimerase [Thermoleophilales bacterium]
MAATRAPMLAACEWIFASTDVASVLARLAAAGCGGIELSGEPDRADRAELRAALHHAGIHVTGITAICSAPTDDRDLSHPDAAARRRAVDYYRGCVDLAADVGAPTVGLIPAAIGRVDGSVADAWELAVAGAREVAEYAVQHGICIGVEAVNRYETFLVNTADQALAFVADMGADNAGVILDAFHMQLEEQDSAAAVAAAAPRLRALHLADSNRLGLGRGQLDVAPLVSAAHEAGFDGPFVFEFTAPGPNPFQPDKGEPAMSELDGYARDSVAAVTSMLAAGSPR